MRIIIKKYVTKVVIRFFFVTSCRDDGDDEPELNSEPISVTFGWDGCEFLYEANDVPGSLVRSEYIYGLFYFVDSDGVRYYIKYTDTTKDLHCDDILKECQSVLFSGSVHVIACDWKYDLERKSQYVRNENDTACLILNPVYTVVHE